jgi:predicted metal-dependent HD superfamily phosphohydrolase
VTLTEEWAALLRRVGASRGIEWTGELLLKRWAAPHRRYHNVDHLTAVLRLVDRLAAHTSDPDAVRLAAWYHDAVYGGRPSDEAESAQVADMELRRLNVAPELVAEVTRLIRLTARHNPVPGDRNGEVLCDADLAILASPPPMYDAYAEAVRAEYAQIADDRFRIGRVRVLRSLLARPALFSTPYGQRYWERPARVNVERELARLTAAPPFAPTSSGNSPGSPPPRRSHPGTRGSAGSP